MKNSMILIFYAILMAPVIIFPCKVSGAASQESGTKFSDITGKEWILSELKKAGKTVSIDRKKLEADNMGSAFTLIFNEDQVSGMGAPNRYFAPYTASANRSLSIGYAASTMMLAFREPEELKEKEFFDYLAATQRWDLFQGKLELYSKDETVLVFELK